MSEAKDGHGGDGLTVPCKRCGEPIRLPGDPARYGTRRPALTCATCIEGEKFQREEQARQAAERAHAEALAAVRADLPAALASCGVPPRWRLAHFDACPDVPGQLRQTVAAWAQRPEGMLYLFGAPGAGKSWLATAAIRHVLCAGIFPPAACRFTGEREFLAGIKDTFGSRPAPASPKALPDGHAYKVALLIFDDLGASRLTEWARGEIAGLIEYRHGHELPTIITSNLAPDELAAAVDGRILSRIAETRLMLHFPSRDLRVTGTLWPANPAA